MHKLVRSLVISCPKSFTRSKINILNVNFPQCESLSSLQSFHSVSSQELEEEVITDPKIYQFFLSDLSERVLGIDIFMFAHTVGTFLLSSTWNICHLIFFHHQHLQYSLGPFISKLPVTVCNHFMHT